MLKLAQCELIIASGEARKTVKQSAKASGEANMVLSNLVSAYKANLASCEAKRVSPSLNALPALGKAKAQYSAKVQACKPKALPHSAKKALFKGGFVDTIKR